jgi:hypothetical protein
MFDDPRWGDDARDRDRHDAGPELARGPSSNRAESSDRDPRDRNDERWPQRDRDPRDVFMRDLSLPRGRDRVTVYDARDRKYTLRGSETRTLSIVGAFRVVSARDLRGHDDRPADPRSGDLRHLREHGLVRTDRLPGQRDHVGALTDRGRDLLTSHRVERHGRSQEFYSRLVKPREVEHDSQVFNAYLREAEKLADRGVRIDRVSLDYELKREYQQWLHQRDRGGDGRPNRDASEIEEWARDHDLPYFDEQVVVAF